MENSLFPLKYRLRKTDELVEIVAWETTVKGARSETDWVSYIDSHGNEHIMEHLTLEWDFVIQTPFEKVLADGFGSGLNKYDLWEARRYEMVKELFFKEWDSELDFDVDVDDVVALADEIIEALKKEPKKGL